LAVDSELHLVISRWQLWTTRLARPKNHSRKSHRVGIARVPNETIQSDVSRHRRRSTTTEEAAFTSRRRRRSRRPSTFTLCLRRKLPDRLPCRIQKLQIDIGSWLRLQRVVDHDAVRGIPAE